MVSIKRHHDYMVDFSGNGKEVRIERRFAALKPEPRLNKLGKPKMTKAGMPITSAVPDVDEKGVLKEPAWVLYELVACEPFKNEDGDLEPDRYLHPWHGERTNMEKVWMPIGEGTEAEVRAQAEKLVGKLPAELKPV